MSNKLSPPIAKIVNLLSTEKDAGSYFLAYLDGGLAREQIVSWEGEDCPALSIWESAIVADLETRDSEDPAYILGCRKIDSTRSKRERRWRPAAIEETDPARIEVSDPQAEIVGAQSRALSEIVDTTTSAIDRISHASEQQIKSMAGELAKARAESDRLRDRVVELAESRNKEYIESLEETIAEQEQTHQIQDAIASQLIVERGPQIVDGILGLLARFGASGDGPKVVDVPPGD